MKTGTENLSARFVGARLPSNLYVPSGEDWPQSRTDVIKHPEVQLFGTAAGKVWEQRLAGLVEKARARGEKNATILLIAEAVNFVKDPTQIISTLKRVADSVEVVFFARDQRTALPSWLAQRIQSWTQPGFTRLSFDDLLRPRQRSYKYDEILSRWSVAGVRVIPVPFLETDRGTDSLVKRFAKAVKISVPDSSGGQAVNESLGEAQLVSLGLFKEQFAWARRTPGLSALVGWLFNKKRTAFRASPSERWKPNTAELSRISDFYADSNANFKMALGKSASEAEWKTWFDSLKFTETV